jgi:hypothetical protein
MSRNKNIEELKETINTIGKEQFLELIKSKDFAIVYTLSQNDDLRQFVNDSDDKIDEIDLNIFQLFQNIIRANYNQAMVTNNDARNVMALYHEEQHNELKKMIAERKKLVDQRNLLIESAQKDYNDMMFNTIRA